MLRAKALLFLSLFLFSQVSFSIELHYCHEELTGVSFVGRTKCVCLDNHNEQHNSGCETHENECSHDEEVKIEDDCCSTASIEVEQSKEVVETSKTYAINSTLFISPFNFNASTTYSVLHILPETYIPPLFKEDKRVLIQCFRI